MSTRNTRTNSFKQFPVFTTLTLADREEYESYTKDFPPYSTFSFVSLMSWFHVSISVLGTNVVLYLWGAHDELPGITVLGTDKVDETLCAVLDHCISNGERPRLVHVPEYAVSNIEYPELFHFKEERKYDEYIIAVARYYPLEKIAPMRRRKIKKFVADWGKDNLILRSIDLDSETNRQLLIRCADNWWKQNSINDFGALEYQTLKSSVTRTEELGIQNVCIYIDGRLAVFCLYYKATDKRYVNLLHFRMDLEVNRLFDFATYALAEWFNEQGVAYVNLDIDLGLQRLRIPKLLLGPNNFFRKYTIEPAR